MPADIFKLLQKVRINDRPLRLSRLEETGLSSAQEKGRQPGRTKKSNSVEKSLRPRGKNQTTKTAGQPFQA
jgi:hypothetical protein